MKDIANKLALGCRDKDGRVSEELFNSVSRLIASRLRAFNVDFNTELGFAYLCAQNALDKWQPETGDYPITVFYTTGYEAQKYWVHNGSAINFPINARNAGGVLEMQRDEDDFKYDDLFGGTDGGHAEFLFKNTVEHFITTLKPIERLYFDLFYQQGLTRKEIMQKADLTESNIRWISSNVKKQMRAYFTPENNA